MTMVGTRYLVRPGRAGDADDLAALQAATQLQPVTGGEPDPAIEAWVRDLMDGHPSVTPDDFLVVEDTATGRPAASLVGLRQDWYLGGARLPVGQVELVATAPGHRGNRLTEMLFAALHDRYRAGGVTLQMIEGIPYFYRRLGYDYALADDGAPSVPAASLPADGDDGSGAGLTVRAATVDDADALAAIDRRLTGDQVLSCPRDAGVWRYEIAGRRAADIARNAVAVLVDGAEVVGYLVHSVQLYGAGELVLFAAACDRPADWTRAAPAMLAHLGVAGRQHTVAGQSFNLLRQRLNPQHPLVRLGPPGVPKRQRGWYLRTTDPVELLAHLTPVLRARWAGAGLRWPASSMTIDTYGRAARLEFTDGELTAVTAGVRSPNPAVDPGTHAAIPPGALLQLALGYRTLPEVLAAWPDCVPRDRRTEQFLTAAFPPVEARLWPRA
ncbi:GNAT family N-acetyltransferase [Actinoplanes sp. NPDC026670]|uniref:GNAT family N-acetyltransferase n=1 Tax=Actinoplanes sp. NPDC026670 TaxID=3154700 RepID=UPI0033FAB952